MKEPWLKKDAPSEPSDQNRLHSIQAHHTEFLVSLQNTLSQHYDIEIPYCVSEFVCDNATRLQEITGTKVKYNTSSEMLIYQQVGNNLDISLYLSNALLDSIDSTKEGHSSEAFNNTCVLIEGVSHFLYLVWNAHYDRQLSHLDLELQAEVDKYIFLAHDGAYVNSTDQLLTLLFEQVHYRSELTQALRQRYEKATELAYRYCSWLNCEFDLSSTPNRKLSAELVRFYRLNGIAKQRYINRHLQQLAA